MKNSNKEWLEDSILMLIAETIMASFLTTPILRFGLIKVVDSVSSIFTDMS